MNTRFKKALAAILSSAIVTSQVAGLVMADTSVEPATTMNVQFTAEEQEKFMSNDEMFAAYVEHVFAPETYGFPAKYGSVAGSSLSAADIKLRDAILTEFTKIANGESESANFKLNIKDIFGNIELSQETANLIGAAIRTNLLAVLCNNPYSAYWFNKEQGYQLGISGTEITVYCSVAEAYTSGKGNGLDVSKTALAKEAADNAKAIVSDAMGMPDLKKLDYYREQICELTDYNDDALDPSTPYGDPWQMVYVFDGDPDTKVVCEGYSKAFQYLCDMTTFNSSSIYCYTVTGMMAGGTGAGGHMWNIVHLQNDLNYLVDITNSDEGTIGSRDSMLFLKGATSGTADTQYNFVVKSGSVVSYAYDPDMSTVYTASDLTLAMADSDIPFPTDEPIPTPTVEPTIEPTVEPTIEPTVVPTFEPTATPVPTVEPTTEPTAEPTVEPTTEPTAEPTVEPTIEPTAEPTTEPTVEPTTEPTVEPTVEVTTTPTTPTAEPTVEPTVEPTIEPTAEPTAEPTVEPTTEPTAEPTTEPTVEPTAEPTVEPTVEPTTEPTAEPTTEPTAEPTIEPTAEPTAEPTVEPTTEPTVEPTTEPTVEPTTEPTVEPTTEPTAEPTAEPTVEPTIEPTAEPTAEPTVEPTTEPTVEPTTEPTAEPTAKPTVAPTVTTKPVATSTPVPTVKPTATPKPTATTVPTAKPTATSTPRPTATPIPTATATPTAAPTATATPVPTATAVPTTAPTVAPTVEVTTTPTEKPTTVPTAEPTAKPTQEPTAAPTAEPTTEPTAAPTAEPTKAPAVEEKADVSSFAERLYTTCLGRDSEEEGKDYWSSVLKSGKTGAEVAEGFFFSPEFEEKQLTDEEYIRSLYETFMGRTPADEEVAYWAGEMKNGQDRKSVFDGFVNSTEWADICLDYGIKSGGLAEPTHVKEASEEVKGFAERLYTSCLGRDSEDAGLKYWASELANLKQSGTEAARGFFFSPEFIDLKLSNKEFVTRLYETFMGREPDEAGFEYWVGQLDAGETREVVFDNFSVAPEFADICAEAGIIR